MNQLAKDGQKEEASQEEIMESLDNGPIPEEKSTPAGGVTMDMIHKSVPRSDIKFVDFAKMEPKVMSDKKNAILIDGQDIPMNQFFTEQDLQNVQTDSETEAISNQKMLEMIMRK